MTNSQESPVLPYAHGGPPVAGRLRVAPEDFRVDEVLGFTPRGEGSHAYLHIRKTGNNTEWVARQLAKCVGVKLLDIGYAGLKDRNAVTTQWFSVNMAGRSDPDWSVLDAPGITVIAATRHDRKLRRGSLQGNRFELRVRDVVGDIEALPARLTQAAELGIPNYFGEQRFGREGANLHAATALFAGARRERDRHKRGLYLSAARSYLFNQVLGRRVADGTWNRALAGDVLMLEGSHSIFGVESVDGEIERRIGERDVHPTGPLWGRGALRVQGEPLRLEREIAAALPALAAGLEDEGMEQERRALRIAVHGLEWQRQGSDLTLAFRLPAGAYATVLIREVVATDVQVA